MTAIVPVVVHSSIVLDAGRALLIAAAVVGTAMVVIGLFEELPGIVRDTARRSAHR